MAYSDSELVALMSDLESQSVERKRSAGDRSAIRRNICAFANDLPGLGRPGVIFIGVEDDGQPSGIAINDDLLRLLAQMAHDGNILPLPSMAVEKRTLDGADVVVVVVEPSLDLPVRYQGRSFVKIGPTVRLATPEEEQRLTERRRASDLSFDMRPARGAQIDDLDLSYMQEQYLPRAVAPDVLEQNQRSLDQQLRSLRLLVEGAPCWGALLAFGRDPQRWLPGAYVQFLRLDGVSLTSPIRDQKILTGRIEDILRRLDDLLELNISRRTEIQATLREQSYPDYPAVALQQLTRNAVMHRSYEGTHAPVRVYWYSDRVEIQNPGGLYGKVTPENFGHGVTDYRNPLVAEIMHHLGFAQRFGLGLPLAKEHLARNGNPPPEFTIEPTHVVAILRAAS